MFATILFMLFANVTLTDPLTSLRSIDERPVPIDGEKIKATAFIFVTNVCPIANSYQPRLRELQAEFEGQGIQFVEVYPIASITKEAVAKHRKEFDIKAACVMDADRSLAKRLRAKVTPEAIVVDRSGQVLYRGRIDDQHAALGKKRPQATQHDLAGALNDIAANRPVAVAETPGVGCIIRY